ncbi:hypothetical protein BCR35DRAFT_302528 [Leucosporidium creatinivorum]|uniref:Uncharacterized protein n=1 Tax=Leucosporidium creatinivorum TaxID=106004 RepID=A0A1Y2FRK5_9BASI|nr:hypothetical protein BCR35DRAFT_302528 [Leucosporidium creatinivorum]
MDGVSKYRWYRRGISSSWTLDKKLPNGRKQIMAKSKVPIWTASRCHLLINRLCEHEQEVILGTALAMIAWRNWR